MGLESPLLQDVTVKKCNGFAEWRMIWLNIGDKNETMER